ncbi:hypothetical protein ACIFQM_01055 [Paenibacillus sp. NRS-1782]|uniref:hypothetical protein n=1 Tax=unclassified Paenibacillus TaxID=185978 RepID=UPI003D27DC11
MSEVIKRDQNGYKIYPLPDGSEVLWAEEDRVLFRRSNPESMPLTIYPDGVFEDLFALVDSLQQQMAERDRTIAQLNVAIEIHKDNVHDWNRTIDKMVVEAAGLRKALEEAYSRFHSISELSESQFAADHSEAGMKAIAPLIGE